MKYLLYFVAIVALLSGIAIWQRGQAIPASGVPEPLDVMVEDVVYHATTTGYYAYPAGSADYPGVIMIHEWWGLNDHIRERARQLAAEGYRVLAVDLYSGQVATSSADAMKYRAQTAAAETTENMLSGVVFLQSRGATKIASLGWCYGGGKSLELALSGEPLDATIIYYGTPLVTSPAQLAAIDWPVLGIFGEEDGSIPTTTVAQFDGALDSLTIPNEIYVYPGVGHAFANPSSDNYTSAEAADAWVKTLAFLRENL